MTNLTKIAEKAAELDFDLEKVKLGLKRVQSAKCRLKKMKEKPSYETEMREVLAEEQLLKEVRDYIEPKKVTVTTMTLEQIQALTYDETVKAIKSIQSKKCLSQFATKNIEDNVEYQEACRIEEMLKEHRKTVKPIEDNVVKKSNINDLIEQLSNQESTIDKEYILEQLKNLM